MSGFMEGEYSASDVERFVSGAVDDERAIQGEELEAMRVEIQTAIARAEAAEARCKRLADILREAIEWDGHDSEGIPAVWMHKAATELQQMDSALSDTAQQETPNVLKAIDESRMLGRGEGKADMRERAAKLIETRTLFADTIRKDLAAAIRALPIEDQS